MQKQLLVMLAAGYNRDEKLIGTVNSYRDGGYEYSFVLSDSFKLQLDETYTIQLLDPSIEKDKAGGNNYKYDKHGHKILMSGTFHYEDYELKSIDFKARIDKATHYPGEKASVYLKATDENDLPVPDGRVNLTLVTNYVNYYKAPHVFVPDTLWTHKITLDPIGETKVVIPDSIFTKADVNYRIDAEFLNSSNEREEQSVSATYKHERYKITTELSRDTLKATCLEFGKEIKVPAIIAALDANDDTLSKTKVMLPSKTVINPYATSYNIETDSTDTDFELTKEDAGISLSAVRTSDSLFIKADNPRSLHFWYSVYADGKLIENGQADQLFYKKAYPNSKTVGVRIDYIWGGELKTGATAAVYRKDLLNINVNQPVSIYPGQQAQTSIVVTDADGKAVPGVDVTAWALTRKFSNYRAPSLPYFGRSYPYRYSKRYERDSPDESSGSLKLNWSRFSHEMGLDSIAYYQFTHAKTIYQREEPGTDTVTQIAPFVVKNGDIIPVYILYIDEKPVYFSQAQQLQRYSFIVRPGLHSIRLRTSHQNIRMDSVCVEPSKKLIIGLNADYLPSVKQSDTLSQYETDLINKYMITMDNNFGNKMAVIRQNENVFLLNPNALGKSKILTGPLKDNHATFDLQGESPRFFLTEPGYSYLFEPGLLRQTSIPTKYPFNRVLSSSPGIDDYTQYAITQARADSIWQQYLDLRNSSEELFENKPANTSQTGQLVFKREVAKNESPELIKNIIIYKNGDPDFALIYPGKTTTFNNLAGGTYRLLFLLQGDSYDIRENINIKPHGINYYGMRVLPTHLKDSVSLKINGVINNRNGRHDYTDYDIRNDALKIKEAFNEKYFNTSGFTLQASGVVTSNDDRTILPGVSVTIKGTNAGTVTDIEGKFTLKV
ncbi:MAG: carboxypeptidase-like regulatory domain-containing protein, partial [Mucilaginibacter sp.]